MCVRTGLEWLSSQTAAVRFKVGSLENANVSKISCSGVRLRRRVVPRGAVKVTGLGAFIALTPFLLRLAVCSSRSSALVACRQHISDLSLGVGGRLVPPRMWSSPKSCSIQVLNEDSVLPVSRLLWHNRLKITWRPNHNHLRAPRVRRMIMLSG